MGGKRRPDPLHHPIQIVPHVRIAIPQRSITLASQHGVSQPIVVLPTVMGSPIDFHDKTSAVANEVEELAAERGLPTEVEAIVA